jgi:uncharacterized protein YndB with AHSA1/START domain
VSPTTDEDLRVIRVDEFLPHPPAKVWRALTDPELLARWLMPNDFKLEIGHRFTVQSDPKPAIRFDGVGYCEVLDFEVERILRISWCDRPGGENGLDSTVTWQLVPEGRGTRLFVEHAGFDPDNPYQQLSRRVMGGREGGQGGWHSSFRRISQVLIELEPAA